MITGKEGFTVATIYGHGRRFAGFCGERLSQPEKILLIVL